MIILYHHFVSTTSTPIQQHQIDYKGDVNTLKLANRHFVVPEDVLIDAPKISNLTVHWSAADGVIENQKIQEEDYNPQKLFKKQINVMMKPVAEDEQEFSKSVRLFLSGTDKANFADMKNTAIHDILLDVSLIYDVLPRYIWYTLHSKINDWNDDIFDKSVNERVEMTLGYVMKDMAFWDLRTLLDDIFDKVDGRNPTVWFFLTFQAGSKEFKTRVFETVQTKRCYKIKAGEIEILSSSRYEPEGPGEPKKPILPELPDGKRAKKGKKSISTLGLIGIAVSVVIVIILLIFLYKRFKNSDGKKVNENTQNSQ